MFQRLVIAATLLAIYSQNALSQAVHAPQSDPLGSTVVNLSPAVQLLWQAAAAALAIIVPWVVTSAIHWFSTKTKIAITDQAAVVVDRAFQNGVNLATSRLQSQFGGQLTLDVHNQLASTVLNYVLDHAGPELKKLGIDPIKSTQQLAEKALARLAGAGIVPPANGTPLTVMPPAVPIAPGVGLVTGPGVAPPETAIATTVPHGLGAAAAAPLPAAA